MRPSPHNPTSPPHPPGTALAFPMEPQPQQGLSLSPLSGSLAPPPPPTPPFLTEFASLLSYGAEGTLNQA